MKPAGCSSGCRFDSFNVFAVKKGSFWSRSHSIEVPLVLDYSQLFFSRAVSRCRGCCRVWPWLIEFKCALPSCFVQGCCHVWSWLIDFKCLLPSCFTHSRSTIWTQVSSIQTGRLAHTIVRSNCMSWVMTLVNTAVERVKSCFYNEWESVSVTVGRVRTGVYNGRQGRNPSLIQQNKWESMFLMVDKA